ncbi:hypothetical protein B0I35DRAFT_515192, partial [Stachybotrys elegans]
MSTGFEFLQPPRELTPAELESNLPKLLGLYTSFFALAIISVVVRLYTRICIVKITHADDVVVALAGVMTILSFVTFVRQGYYGLGRHWPALTRDKWSSVTELAWFQSVTLVLGVSLLKISLALSLLRLSQARWYTITQWVLIVFICMYTAMGIIVFLLQCRPLKALWMPELLFSGQATCIDFRIFIKMGVANTSFNILTDVLTATLPIPTIVRLNMPLKTRMYLIFILGLGYIAVALGIVKAFFQIAFSSEQDGLYEYNVQTFAFLQLTVATMTACAPTLRPLLSRVLKLSSGRRSSREYYATIHTRR